MVKCPWCNEWEGPPAEYSDHLKYCKKYPPNIEAMKEQAQVHPIETLPQTLPLGFEEWHGIKGFSAVIADRQHAWTVQLKDMAGNVVTVTGIMSINFEEFPEEPIPFIESLSISRSSETAFVTGFPELKGKQVIITANFKGTARVRKEMVSLFFFYETLT